MTEFDLTEDWNQVRLGEIARRRTEGWKPGDGELPYLGLEHIAPYRLKISGRGSSDDVSSNKSKFQAGDILYGKLRPYFRKCVRPTFDGVCSTDIWVVQPKPGAAVTPEFLYWVMADEAFSDYANSAETGTRMPRANWGWVENYLVNLPSISEQDSIAMVLDQISEKILANERLQSTIGALILAECEARFEVIEEGGFIPLTQAVKLVNGGAYTKGASGSGRMVIRIKELTSGESETTVYNDVSVPHEKTARLGDVLFAWSGTLGVWRWYGRESIVNQHIFKVLPGKHPIWLGWVHITKELERFKDIAAGKATTMGHVTKQHLDSTLVPELSAETLEDLSVCIEPLWALQEQLGQESLELTELRDFLIPRLLSGELKIGRTAAIEGVQG